MGLLQGWYGVANGNSNNGEARDVDFGGLPPEVNSGRMYSGPGSGPLLAAAAAWRSLAAELSSTASAYDSVLSGLTSEVWAGPSSAAMTAAATPYVAWMEATATQAEQSAVQATAAAAAYDAAFTATVPPPVIAANRSLLMALIATNILGQNTPAIAATEADYGEMWAQDAAAMYGYAGASANATQLTPYTPPPPTTNAASPSGQAAAVANATAATGGQAQTVLAQLTALVPQALQGLALSGPSAAQAESPILAILDALAGPLSPISLFGIGGVPYLLAIQCILLPMNGSNVVAAVVRAEKMAAEGTWSPPTLAGLEGGPHLVSSSGPASAGMANAGSVGRLSVPQGWAAALPEADATVAPPGTGSGVTPVVAPDGQSGVMSSLALGGLAGRAIGASGGAASRAVGAAAGTASKPKPTKATIIVIPPSAED